MSIRLGLHASSHAHIRERLDALALEIDVAILGDDGSFALPDGTRTPEDMDLDYMWISSHIGPVRDQVFDAILRTRQLGVLQTFNAGLDDPFYAKAAARGIRLCNSSAQGIAIAEYTFGQVMAVLQPIEHQRALQAAGTWQRTPFREIGRTAWLIIGYGPIGQAIAKRAKAFEAEVQVVRRSPATDPLVDRMGTPADLPEMLGRADVVIIAAPLNDATRGMANAAFFSAVKPGAILVNVARGGLVEDQALVAALDSGQVATAILDVFHTEPLPAGDPLWTHPGVRMTSHTSFSGDGVQGRWDQLFLDNIQRFAAGEPLINEVDPGLL